MLKPSVSYAQVMIPTEIIKLELAVIFVKIFLRIGNAMEVR